MELKTMNYGVIVTWPCPAGVEYSDEIARFDGWYARKEDAMGSLEYFKEKYKTGHIVLVEAVEFPKKNT